uniref:Uncharacterized protein n=1 Tax=Haemonchus placei TaxID=6290 RepID=A0A0N4XA35_HAEPC
LQSIARFTTHKPILDVSKKSFGVCPSSEFSSTVTHWVKIEAAKLSF